MGRSHRPIDISANGARVSDGVLEGLLTIRDWERAAQAVTSPAEWEFLYGDPESPEWSTYASNAQAFSTVKFRPRVLRGGVPRTTSTTVLGTDLDFPVLVGPTGGHGALGPEAECATARACGDAGTAFVLSALASSPVDDVASAADGPWWQQVFIYNKYRSVTTYQLRRAEDLGASAIMVTVSHVAAPWTHNRFRHRFAVDEIPVDQYPPASSLADMQGDYIPSMYEVVDDVDREVSWNEIDWLRSQTAKPLVVKGIQTAEDALLCVEHGLDGLVVSNHGGRFLQGARGSFEALPEIVDAVGDRITVMLDGGVRHGEDVLKALAVGAKAVLIGRASRWGLRVAGARGLEAVLGILRRELDDAMALCGVRSISEIDAGLVSRDSLRTREV